MPRIELTRAVPAPPEQVWAALSDLASHAEWMKDAESIEFVTGLREGKGTVMHVMTRVGPFRTLDVLEVTGWVEGESIEVAHRGLVAGRGVLGVAPRGKGSVVTWVEELSFPLWLGGRLAAWAAKPVLEAIWVGNLRRLEESITAP